MNAEISLLADDENPSDRSNQSRRDRLATTLPGYYAFAHFAVIVAIALWYGLYFYHLKSHLAARNANPSALATGVIWHLDLLSNYWYLLLLPLYVALKADVWIMHWIANEIGLREVAVYAAFVTLLLLTYVAVQEYVLLYL